MLIVDTAVSVNRYTEHNVHKTLLSVKPPLSDSHSRCCFHTTDSAFSQQTSL